MFVCLFVCLLFIGHTTFVHFAALPPSTPRAAKPSRAAPRARRGQACTARARARMPYNFTTKKSLRWCLSKTKPYARAHAVVYVTAEIFKKTEKENQHATSQVQFTVCLLLECLLFESYWIVLDLWSEPTLVSSSFYKRTIQAGANQSTAVLSSNWNTWCLVNEIGESNTSHSKRGHINTWHSSCVNCSIAWFSSCLTIITIMDNPGKLLKHAAHVQHTTSFSTRVKS